MAHAHAHDRSEVMVVSTNEGAIHLWKKPGFVNAGVTYKQLETYRQR